MNLVQLYHDWLSRAHASGSPPVGTRFYDTNLCVHMIYVGNGLWVSETTEERLTIETERFIVRPVGGGYDEFIREI